METVQVQLGERSYPARIAAGAEEVLASSARAFAAASRLVVIADADVARLHLATVQKYLPSQPLVVTFAAGEDSKTLATASQIFEELVDARVDRQALILTLGGGVAGDLGGFVAATFLRGVRYVHVPTTLLAAIDASIGGKTGVNLRAGKNLVGAIWQPAAVLMATEFLATLPPREFTAGLAESVKHAAIRDADLLGWHEQHGAELIAKPELWVELIARNCAIKAAVVSQDEREAGLRAILNYGHTVGHAIEHVLEYELRHGECVALGMLVANEIARARAWLDVADADRIARVLAQIGLPAKLPRPLDPGELIEVCRVDKKVRDGKLNFVLLRRIGEPERAVVHEDEVRAALAVIQSA